MNQGAMQSHSEELNARRVQATLGVHNLPWLGPQKQCLEVRVHHIVLKLPCDEPQCERAHSNNGEMMPPMSGMRRTLASNVARKKKMAMQSTSPMNEDMHSSMGERSRISDLACIK